MEENNEVLEWLRSTQKFGSKPGLECIRRLLFLMGTPHEKFKSIQVTGTNGKGSTVAIVASILREEGFKVGMFTSPHLSSYTERIVIDGKKITLGEITRIVKEIIPLAEKMEADPKHRHPTFFEVTAAIAFKHFSNNSVDFAVLEVGMGGRLDATNVVNAVVSIITNVSLEHTKELGDTVLKIAKEKAGIIKKNGVLITATEDDAVYSLFKEICEKTGSKIFRIGRDVRFYKTSSNMEGQRFKIEGLFLKFKEVFIPLLGEHQIINAATAVGAIEALRFSKIIISNRSIVEGLSKVEWPGRLEIMQREPLVVLDCAKDLEAVKALRRALQEEFAYEKLIAVVSISSDKKISEMIGQLVQVTDFFIVTSHKVMGRAASPAIIIEEIRKHSKEYLEVKDVKQAVKRATELAEKNDMVIVTGSVFTVGEAREIWFGNINTSK